MSANTRAPKQCVAILDMFKELLTSHEANQLVFDVIIEMQRPHPNIEYFPVPTYEDLQINNIRSYLEDCIRYRSCPFRVHWSETDTNEDRDDYNVVDDFDTPDQMVAYVGGRPEITKQFKKAAMQWPVMTEHGWVDLYQRLLKSMVMKQTSAGRWVTRFATNNNNITYYARRALVDVYAVARIVSQRMKHVIFYGGYLHTLNMGWLLEQLGFKVVETRKRHRCKNQNAPQSATRPGAIFNNKRSNPLQPVEPSAKQFIELCKRHPMRSDMVGVHHQVLLRGPRYWKTANGNYSREDDGCIVCLIGEIHRSSGERPVTARVADVMVASAYKAYKAALENVNTYDDVKSAKEYTRASEAFELAVQRQSFSKRSRETVE